MNQEQVNNLLMNPDNVRKGSTYRISVLTERLIRLEYNKNGIFNDQETELVKFRNFDRVEDLTVKEDNKYLEIKTKYFSLFYNKEKPFIGSKIMPSLNLKVDLNNTDKTWYFNHAEARNYNGNFVSLDGKEEDFKPRKGLYSIDGFASIDDSNSYIIQNTKIENRQNDSIDIYLFMYNKDYYKALEDYYKLTNYPSMIPRYALGNWWSRDITYNEEDVKELISNFNKAEIPISVIMLDNDWHINKDSNNNQLESGYTFNKELFPNPKQMIEELHKNNIKLGLKINPSKGIYPIEEHYKDFITYYKIEDGKIIAFDPLNKNLLNGISKFMLEPLKQEGVDFFWNDIDTKGIDANKLMILNDHLYNDQTINDPNKHSIILARNALKATHRYPITYTGKTVIGWEMLKKIPTILSQGANIGVSFISNDVNGNYGGIEESELYIRAIEEAVFTPIVRFNAPRGRYYRKEPWRWDAKTKEVIGTYLRLRNKLIPYLYTKAYEYHSKGNLLVKPLYYNYPWIYDDSDYKYEYLFGDMLVSPIVKKKDTLIDRTIQRVFIPDGVWYDFITGKKFLGKKEYISFYRDEDYPIFVKRGAIIPLAISDDLNFTDNPDKFEIQVFPGESNTFNLYEDKSDDKNKVLITQIDYNYLPSNYTVIIRTLKGERGIVSDYRDYKIRFRNTKQANDVICYYNDTQIKTVSYLDSGSFVVEINHVPSIGQITLNCKGKDIEVDALRFINDDIDSILLDLPINTVLKEQISTIMFSNNPIKKKRIAIRKLRKYNLGREYIKLFLKLLEYIGTI